MNTEAAIAWSNQFYNLGIFFAVELKRICVCLAGVQVLSGHLHGSLVLLAVAWVGNDLSTIPKSFIAVYKR